jgi:hypothetical protein
LDKYFDLSPRAFLTASHGEGGGGTRRWRIGVIFAGVGDICDDTIVILMIIMIISGK